MDLELYGPFILNEIMNQKEKYKLYHFLLIKGQENEQITKYEQNLRL